MGKPIPSTGSKLPTGFRFGRLTVLEDKRWDEVLCLCDCGNEHTTRRCRLRHGHCKSCGCFLAETCALTQSLHVKRQRVFRGFSEDHVIGSAGRLARSRFNTVSRKIKERDMYTCALCSIVGYKIQTHHIESWIERPDLRYDPLNLVSLCKPCHIYKAHGGNSRKPPNIEIAAFLKQYVFYKYGGGEMEKHGTLELTEEEELLILSGVIPDRIKRNWDDLSLSELQQTVNRLRNKG